EFVKFRVLLGRSLALGFDAVATGHYARLAVSAEGGIALRRAADRAKDQSYVLAVAGVAALRRCLFPLGDAPSKAAVRAEAAALGLPQAAKRDSYDICFVHDADLGAFLSARLGVQPGLIVDESGAQVGTHDGAYRFTIGQRRGLRLGRPAADGRPRYVTALETESGLVRVGPAESLGVDRFGVAAPVFLDDATRAALAAGGSVECAVQVRAHGAATPCVVSSAAGGPALAGPDPALGGGEAPLIQVSLSQPIRALAAGQTAVLYEGDRVLASGIVER
ncbi:MAG: hypothetical protein LBD97_11080, partial [Bifidobacteriaceae bacterium]|nr:hypothetical protein [Bifidobacteriaceae bacterium]